MNFYSGIVLYELVERWHELKQRWMRRGEAGQGVLYVALVVFVVLAIVVMIGKL
jgi:hypothetical protein